MDNFLNSDFYSPSKGNLKLNQVLEEIIGYVQKKPSCFYDIIVGCDSSSGQDPCFPVVVVILRKGEGGIFFLKKVRFSSQEAKKFVSWKMRILEEVMLSCKFALQLREDLDKKIADLETTIDYEFRYIHADVGENGDTKEMIKEVTGLIRGNGFEPKIKPESFVASSVADHFC